MSGSPTALRRTLIWLLALAAFAAFLPMLDFPRLVFGGGVFATQDVWSMDFALKRLFFNEASGAGASLLDPLNILGGSVAANPTTGIFNPLNFVYALAPFPLAYRLLFVLTYPFAACGFALALMRFWRLEVAVLTTALLVASGVVWSTYSRIFEWPALAWVGWSAWILAFAWERRSWRLALASGVTTGVVLLVGEPLTLPLPAAFVVAMMLASGRWREVTPSRALVVVVAAYGVGVVLAAWPVAHQTSLLLPLASRGTPFEHARALYYSSQPLRLVEMVAPWLRRAVAAAGGPSAVPVHWYDAVGLGMVPCALVALATFDGRRRVALWLAVAAPLVLWLLALGRHLPGGETLWANVYPLTVLRFPEKFLRQALTLALPLMAQGASIAWGRWPRLVASRGALVVLGAVAITTLENRLALPELPMLSPQAPPPDALRGIASPDAVTASVRLQSCMHGVLGHGSPGVDLDTRGWGLPMVATASTFAPPLLKLTSCDWMLAKHFSLWLGMTHVVMPLLPEAERAELAGRLGLTWLADDATGGFSLLATREGAPNVAFYSPDYAMGTVLKGEDLAQPTLEGIVARWQQAGLSGGHLLVDPDQYLDEDGMLRRAALPLPAKTACPEAWRAVPFTLGASRDVLSLEASLPCAGVVSLPWLFQPGWRATVGGAPQTLRRIDDLTLGLVVPSGPLHAELRFEPPGFVREALACWLAAAGAMLMALVEVRPRRRAS